jgi:hypothetical protein
MTAEEEPLDPDKARALALEVAELVQGRPLTPEKELECIERADKLYACRIEAMGRVLAAEGLVVRDDDGWWVPAPSMAGWDAQEVRKLMKAAADSDTLRPRIDNLVAELMAGRTPLTR